MLFVKFVISSPNDLNVKYKSHESNNLCEERSDPIVIVIPHDYNGKIIFLFFKTFYFFKLNHIYFIETTPIKLGPSKCLEYSPVVIPFDSNNTNDIDYGKLSTILFDQLI